jgi:hypothetical protein
MATKADNKSATAKRFNHQIDEHRFALTKLPYT